MVPRTGDVGRRWSGVCIGAQSLRTEATGASTYAVSIAPELWLLTQRRNCRLFQHRSIPEILGALLDEWGIRPAWRITPGLYPPLELRVQYDETDFAFFCRLLEEAGITYRFEDTAQGPSQLVLDEAPHEAPARAPLPFVDQTFQARAGRERYVTAVQVVEEVRPNAVTHADFSFYNARYPVRGTAADLAAGETPLEQYRYLPGSALREDAGAPLRSGATPVADDLGHARFHPSFTTGLAQRALDGVRVTRRRVPFETSEIDLAPGVVFGIAGHPRPDLDPEARLLVRRLTLSGTLPPEEPWTAAGDAVFAAARYRPAMETPAAAHPRCAERAGGGADGARPRAGRARRAGGPGAQCRSGRGDLHRRARARPGAAPLGSRGARGRARLHLDAGEPGLGRRRLRAVRGAAGGHRGAGGLPRRRSGRSGDRGRLHNVLSPQPYRLPENKTVSTFRTQSSPGGGGFNELRFDDAAGREHVYLQAEAQMDTLVKLSLREAVGYDRTRYVQNDESIAVGNDRIAVVQNDEAAVTGAHRRDTVGLSRTATVGVDDSTFVGSRWSVTVARGLTPRLAGALRGAFEGPLGSTLRSTAAAVLGRVTHGPAGSGTGPFEGALATFGSASRRVLSDVLGLVDGFCNGPGPLPTRIEALDRRIELTTGEASIILDGPNITLRAEGNVVLHALQSVTVLGEHEVAAAANGKIGVVSMGDDIVVQAGKKVRLNPYKVAGAADAARPLHPENQELVALEAARSAKEQAT